MKRLKLIIIIFFVFVLSGCIKESEVTKEKGDAVAEYMAGLLLKYDDLYEQDLIPLDEILEDDADLAVITPASKAGTGENSTSSTSSQEEQTEVNTTDTLTEVIGNKNFKINYTGYKLADTYPEDSESLGFTLSKREGFQFLVTEFSAENITKNSQNLNLAKDDILYQMKAYNDVIYKPLLTLLENDLRFIDVTVDAGKARKVLLVFEIPKNNDITNLSLVVSKGEKSYVIEIK